VYSGNRLVKLIRSGDSLLGIYGRDFSEGRYLIAFSATTMQPAWILDFDKYMMPPAFVESDRNYITERVNWAWIEAGVLYVSNFHNTYAKSSRGLNGYLNAFDLASKRLLWRSKPLTINSSEFVIVKDAIVAGYGFTAETHFLYVLDKRDGSVVQTIPVVKSPEHIIVKDGLVYVRTYDTDYVFKILHQ
jgi:outer membrane protein assembly factor BamB